MTGVRSGDCGSQGAGAEVGRTGQSDSESQAARRKFHGERKAREGPEGRGRAGGRAGRAGGTRREGGPGRSVAISELNT